MNSRLVSIVIPTLIFAFPFLSRNVLYIDDFNRGNSGVYAWSADGRPFADLIYWIFNFGGRAVVAYPYTIILALISFIFIVYSICKKNNLGYLYSLGLTFLVVNPYFSQSMLYRYDSSIMVASITIVASCFIYNNNRWLVLSAILLTLSIGTYQTSITLYIVLSCIELIYTRKLGERYASITLIKRALTVVAGVILYKFVLHFCELSNYAEIHSKTITEGGIYQLYQNLKNFTTLLNGATSSFKMSTIILILFVASLLSIMINAISIRNNEYGKIYSLMLTGCTLLCTLLVFGGVSLTLLNPVFEPRVMTASYICAFYLIASSSIIIRERISLIVSCVFAFFSCYVSSAVSFAYDEQSKFNENIYKTITNITDANLVYSSHFEGSPPKSQFVELIESEIPMSKKINFSYFNNDIFSDAALIFHGIKSYTKNDFYNSDFSICDKKTESSFIEACVSGKYLTVKFK